MPKIVTEYVVDASQAFQTADAVEARYVALDKTTASVAAGAEIPKEVFTSIDNLSKSVAGTRQQLELLSKTRLDTGQVNHLTREIVLAQERSRQLQGDIAGIRRELANPLRKSSVAFLTEELRGAELEADALARKLQTVQNVNTGAPGTGGGSGGGHGGLGSGVQRFRGLGGAFRAASSVTGLPITEIEAGAAVSAVEAAGIAASTLAIFGGLAAAGVAAYAITKNIRQEAEKLRDVQFSISGTVNKQILDNQALLKTYQDQRAEQEAQKKLTDEIKQSSNDALLARRDTFQKLFNATPEIEGAKRVEYQKAIDQIDDALKGRQAASAAANVKAFDDANDAFKRSQADFRSNVDKAVTKIQELGKTYVATLDRITRLGAENNPFINIVEDGRKSLEDLKKDIAGLPITVQKAFLEAQKNANATKLFEARLDNRLAAFDLQDQADNLRSAGGTAYVDKQIQAALAKFRADEAGGANRNLTAFINFLGVQGSSASQKLQLFDLRRQTEQAGGLFRNPEFEAEDRARLVRATQENSVQARLDKQLKIIDKLNPATADEKAAADRKIIAITQGIKPEDLTRDQVEAAAGAREREAQRVLNQEAEANKRDEQRNKLLESIDKNQQELLKAAQANGLQGVYDKLKITVEDKTTGGISTDAPKPTPADTVQTYQGDINAPAGTGPIAGF